GLSANGIVVRVGQPFFFFFYGKMIAFGSSDFIAVKAGGYKVNPFIHQPIISFVASGSCDPIFRAVMLYLWAKLFAFAIGAFVMIEFHQCFDYQKLHTLRCFYFAPVKVGTD